MEQRQYNYPSPCLRCVRVEDPEACNNKECRPWRQWFLDRWAMIHDFPRGRMERAELKPVGVNIGGTHYAMPHTVRAYLDKDPCRDCVCAHGMCNSPCPARRSWEKTKGAV